jgi:hypothetical protein
MPKLRHNPLDKQVHAYLDERMRKNDNGFWYLPGRSDQDVADAMNKTNHDLIQEKGDMWLSTEGQVARVRKAAWGPSYTKTKKEKKQGTPPVGVAQPPCHEEATPAEQSRQLQLVITVNDLLKQRANDKVRLDALTDQVTELVRYITYLAGADWRTAHEKRD